MTAGARGGAGAAQEQKAGNQYEHQDREDAVDVVEGQDGGLRLNRPIEHREPLMLPGDDLRHVLEAGSAGHPRHLTAEAPGVEDGEVLDQMRLVNLLVMDQR